MNPAAEFRDYFEAELALLREQMVEFGHDHPASAHALTLSGGSSRDPHVELLMQSFAYLTARLRLQLDRDAALVPSALMEQMYPHLCASIPSLVVAELIVRADGANFSQSVQLSRGREFHACARDEAGRQVHCRMSTCMDAPLVPLQIIELKQVATSEYEGLGSDPAVHSVLRLILRTTGLEPLSSLTLDKLRFYIDINSREAFRLYELLALYLIGVATLDVDGTSLRRQGAGALRWLGFAEDEAALATDLVTHPGHRLVQEYFAFPEKFLFFELSGLDFQGAGAEAELLLLLRFAGDQKLELGPSSLRLNCVPLVNLFTQRLEPLPLDQFHHEYRLSADQLNHRYIEIYRIESLSSVRPGEPARPLSPYFEMRSFGASESMDYSYVPRRVASELRSVPGTETYVSFLDQNLALHRPTHETIGGRAVCTNRRLAEQLRRDDLLQLEGAGPVHAARVASKPTPHQSPALLGSQPWALISQLQLNHLSLARTPEALGALKSMLRLHLGHDSIAGAKQIDSICGLRVAPMVRPSVQEGRRVLVEGLAITLTVDRQRFEGGSPVLLAEVLRRFFALYAAVNTVTELSLATQDKKGALKTWPCLAGEQIVL